MIAVTIAVGVVSFILGGTVGVVLMCLVSINNKED